VIILDLEIKRVDPVKSYQELFAEFQKPSVDNKDLTQKELLNSLKSYVLGSANSKKESYVSQRNYVYEILQGLLEQDSSPEIGIPLLASCILKYGQSSMIQNILKLVNVEDAVVCAENLARHIYGEEGRTSDSINYAKSKLRSINNVFDFFYEMKSRMNEVYDKKNDIHALDEKIKAIEKKIRDTNDKIRNIKLKKFEKDGAESEHCFYGEEEELRMKVKKLNDKIADTPGISEADIQTITLGLYLFENQLKIFDENNHIVDMKKELKKNVKVWGGELKILKQNKKDLLEECDIDLIVEKREYEYEKIENENLIELEFVKQKETEIDGEGVSGVDGEMISVGAAARLAEVMKQNFPSSFMVNTPAPVIQNISSGGSATSEEPAVDLNRPLKPDFDYTNRDKDTLIRLIYDSDDRGIRFEKSAETLEAMAYKSPTKAAQLLISENISHACFFL